MAGWKKDSPHGVGPYGARQQRDLLRGVELPGARRRKPRIEVSFFDSPPPLTIRSEPAAPKPDEVPAIRGGAEYFKGRELPTDVWAPLDVVYYERIEDIPLVPFPKTNIPPNKPPNMASLELRSAIGLKVCPPKGDEPPDASFKIVGERGLYVRVIVGETEETVDGVNRKKQVIRWMHFNEENAAFKDLRYA